MRVKPLLVIAFAPATLFAARRTRRHHPRRAGSRRLTAIQSWASFATITWHRDNYFVTMRYFDPRLRGVIGCDVQQNYVVDWRTFVVSPIKEYWPA